MLFDVLLSYLAVLYGLLLVYTTGESQTIYISLFLALNARQMRPRVGQVLLQLLLLPSLSFTAACPLLDMMYLPRFHAHAYFLLRLLPFHLSSALNIKTVIHFHDVNPP